MGTKETVTIKKRKSETHTKLGTQETVTINNRKYRDTDNIGHTGNSDNQ
jgi:predicted transport protein